MAKLWHEFLPQLIFLLCVFGYMDFLIVVKWFTDYKGHSDEAPSIIVTVVNFFLNGGEIKGREFFSHNVAINNLLLFIALACVPWMLLVKPYLEYKEFKSKKEASHMRGGDMELDNLPGQYQNFQSEEQFYNSQSKFKNDEKNEIELLKAVVGKQG